MQRKDDGSVEFTQADEIDGSATAPTTFFVDGREKLEAVIQLTLTEKGF